MHLRGSGIFPLTRWLERLYIIAMIGSSAPRSLFLRCGDGVAALLSNLCLVHCLLLPAFLALGPALFGLVGHDLHGPGWLHWALILLALPVSLRALVQGQALHHQRTPLAMAAAGFLLMALGALLHGHELAEQALTVSGGLLVAFAHWRNWRIRAAG